MLLSLHILMLLNKFSSNAYVGTEVTLHFFSTKMKQCHTFAALAISFYRWDLAGFIKINVEQTHYTFEE